MSGLIGWWPLHERAGDAADLSGNDNDGTVNGATQGVAGIGGLTAYSFDSTDDYIDCGDVLPQVEQFTFSAWFRLDSSVDEGNIIYSDQGYIQIAGSFADNVLRFNVNDGGGSNQYETFTPNAKQWYHIALSYNGSEGRCYVDGELDGTISASGTPNDGTDSLTIGGTGRWFGGLIGGVRIYDRALSATEIETLYEWGSVDTARPPDNNDGGVSYWDLDGDSVDQWGSNNGTITDATSTTDAIRGTAFDFDGDGSVQDTDFSDDIYSEGTFSLWLKADILDGYAGFYGRQIDGEARAIVVSSTQFTFVAWGTGGSVTTDNLTPQEDVWYNVTLTWSGSTGKIYVNGSLEGINESMTLNSNTSQELTIGDRNDLTQPFDGIIDEVRLYNRELTQREISQLYRYGTFGRDMRKLTTE